MDDRMRRFLMVAREAGWRATTNYVPVAWAEEYREALANNLVRIGFGGSIELTDAGKATVKAGRMTGA